MKTGMKKSPARGVAASEGCGQSGAAVVKYRLKTLPIVSKKQFRPYI